MRRPYEGNERAYWEDRIRRKDRYSGIGVRSLPGNVNRLRKEALFEVVEEVLSREAVDLSSCRVLDAACGTGVYTEFYESRGADVVGVDLAIEALASARKHGVGAGLCAGSISGLPFPDGAFDLAHVFSVLYHIPDDGAWRDALGELCRVVRTGGVLLMRIEWVDRDAHVAGHVTHRSRARYLRALTEEGPFDLGGVHTFRDAVRLQPLFAAAHRILPARLSEALGALVERIELLGPNESQKVVVFRKR